MSVFIRVPYAKKLKTPEANIMKTSLHPPQTILSWWIDSSTSHTLTYEPPYYQISHLEVKQNSQQTNYHYEG
jgi:hypothetical protein